ncbi:hypothetical protein NDN08_006152 [Rhodosorus marinus]|uniref:RPA43 OB domain-containing protein n=1 Tax=Rhodosorus marinus TaxID=101924 RepID=A0AAV8UNR1_9RHOD|nr:hypothetical protein NDN08_006152 [Rhodosorus marinus]
MGHRRRMPKSDGGEQRIDSFMMKGGSALEVEPVVKDFVGGGNAVKEEEGPPAEVQPPVNVDQAGETQDSLFDDDAGLGKDELVVKFDPDPEQDEDANATQVMGEDEIVESSILQSKIKSNTIPLICPPKLEENLVLAQSADVSFDLSGDVGAVGRVKIEEGKLSFDLKGTFYDAGRVACNSMLVVAVGDTEARVSSVIDEYLLLTESTEDTGGEKVLAGNVDFGTEDQEVLNSSDAKPDEKGTKKRKKSELGKAVATVRVNKKARSGSSLKSKLKKKLKK